LVLGLKFRFCGNHEFAVVAHSPLFSLERTTFPLLSSLLSAAILAMRILALDHGTIRVGVAVSDELKIIAQPLEFIPAEPFAALLERLQQILREKEVELILVGLPRNMDGSYGPASEKVKAFVEALKPVVNLPIKLLDERLTSVQANRLLVQAHVRREQRKRKVDAMAAAILLQSYLDSSAMQG
jgi:putative holliday junction resolvase